MSVSDPNVPVRLRLPKQVYERARQAAAAEGRPVAELLSALVAEGLEARATARELLQRVSTQYRARLAGESKLHQPPDEVMQELRELREQVVRELYP